MAEAIVGPLLSKLQEVAVTEAKALAGVGGQIDALRDKLMWLHALLREIEQRSRHDTSRFRRVLASQIREVALQAEDAIDHFHLKADLSRRGWRRAAREVVSNFRTQVRVRFALSRTIQALNARLEEIINNSGKYGAVYTSSEQGKSWNPSSNVPPIRHAWNWEDSVPFELQGLTEEKVRLTLELKDDSVKAVIYICGASGTGKRALLRYAYENEDIRGHFDACVSVSFPPSMSEGSIVQEIEGLLVKVRSLHRETVDKDLCSLRLMVLMNSPISIAKWSKIEPMLLEKVGQGSKIVVAATSEPEEMTAGSIISLGPLTEDKSLLELFDYAMGKGWKGSECKTNAMNQIRAKIRDITNGLPLAVVLLAKFMVTMDYSKWGTASTHIMGNNETDPLKKILLICIDDLPDELKACVLYTAGFPENRVIDAKQLVRLWMAEGFLASQHGMEGEQLGQCYLKELIYRGLLQLIQKSSSTHGGEVEAVAIHELIHPVFRSEVRRTAFMYVHRSGRVVAPDDTRRLALQNYDNSFLPLGDCYGKLRTVVSFCRSETDYWEGTGQAQKHMKHSVRGISPFMLCGGRMIRKQKNDDQSLSDDDDEDGGRGGGDDPKLHMRPLLKGSPYLRVINLEGLDIGWIVPDEIGDMVHLRYLGIRCRSLKMIPSSVGNLRKLETMDVRGTRVRRLPESFWKIRTLRHVLGDRLEFPCSSGDLESMHTLETVKTRGIIGQRSDSAAKRGKRGLRFLHRLHVVGLRSLDRHSLKTVLEDLRCLESLSLSGKAIPIDLFASASNENGGSSIFSCLEHVVFLELNGKLISNRASIAAIEMHGYNKCLLNLSHLVLMYTQVKQDFIDVIAKLPALAELELLVESYTGTDVLFCAQGFSSLRVLFISGLVELERIIGPDDTKRRMNRTISATLVKMPGVRYETHTDCRCCDRHFSREKSLRMPARQVQQLGSVWHNNALVVPAQTQAPAPPMI